MSNRTIKLKLLTQTSLVSISTDVLTLGEFKQLEEVKALDIKWDSSKLMNKGDHATFEVDSARLPNENTIMFVVPTKSKSGLTDGEIDNMSYKEAKAEILERGIKISWMGKSASDLREILKAEVTTETEVAEEPTVKIVINGLKKENVEIVEAGYVVTDADVTSLDIEEDLDIVDYVTGEELDEELESLKEELQ